LQYKSNYLNHEMDPGFANVKWSLCLLIVQSCRYILIQ
jgi:hypothetical protein